MAVRIACCQIAPDVESPAASAVRARESIAGAIDGGAEIVVLPELCTSGYVFRSVDEARAAATPADGELHRGSFEHNLPHYTGGVTAAQIAASGVKGGVLGGPSHSFLANIFSTTVFPFFLSVLLLPPD
jgi:predicted amidohydrolase